MDLTQLQEKLEIKNDINNLKGIELIDKYGRNLNDAINFLKELNIIFHREPNYQLCIGENYNKLVNYIILMDNKYSIDLIKSKTASIKEKLSKNIPNYNELRKMNRLSDEAITKEMDKTGYKYAPSLNIKTYPQLITVLYDECKILNSSLKKESTLPSVNETKDKFAKYYDYARNIDFLMTFKLLDNLYRESPLLQFCFDEKYLLLANYIINSNIDTKTKDKIVELTKDIVNTSINIKPNDFFNGEVNIEEYEKLSKHTLENIRNYEQRRIEEKQDNIYSVYVEENSFKDRSSAFYTSIKKKIRKKILK